MSNSYDDEERKLFEDRFSIPNDVIHCIYTNQYWHIVGDDEPTKIHEELSDKWEAWQARGES